MRRNCLLLGLLALTVSTSALADETKIVAKIDEQLRAAWQSHQITPAPTVDDARFLRRLYLDTNGRLPEPAKVLEFLADTDPQKRSKAIDECLASPNYAEHWTNYWDAVLMGRLTREAYVDRTSFKAWLKEEFEKNTPWSEFVRTLITAEGYNCDRRPRSADSDPSDMAERYNPATNWFLRYFQAIPELSSATSRTFLGVQLQCAQCHDHKTEKWTQQDFKQFTAFYAKTWPTYYDKYLVVGTIRADLRDRWTAPPFAKYEQFFGSYKDYAAPTPKLLNGHEVTGFKNRRVELADWVTSPDNPWFAKAIVNRTWAQLLGQGFVEPIDDFRPGNPPVQGETLDALAKDFVEHKFDLKHLLRAICQTKAYNRACRGPVSASAAVAHNYWSSYPLKQLEVEELFQVLTQSTDSGKALDKVAKSRNNYVQTAFVRQFVTQQGTDDMAEVADASETISRALLLMNGALVSGSTRSITGYGISNILHSGADDAGMIEQLYLRTLSRQPTAAETKHWTEFVHRDRPVAKSPAPFKKVPSGKEAQALNPEIADAPEDADFKQLLEKVKTGADFPAMLKRVKNNADGLLYVKAFEAYAAETPFKFLAQQPGGTTPRDQAYEDLFWALVNSTEFLTNH